MFSMSDLEIQRIQAQLRDLQEQLSPSEFTKEVTKLFITQLSAAADDPSEIGDEARKLAAVIADPSRSFSVSNAEDLVPLLAEVSLKGADSLSEANRFQVLLRLMITRAQLSTQEQREIMLSEVYDSWKQWEKERVSLYNPAAEVPMEMEFSYAREYLSLKDQSPEAQLNSLIGLIRYLIQARETLAQMKQMFGSL